MSNPIIIAHCGDIHIFNLQRHEEYRIQFQKFYDKLNELKPDRIVIGGDLFDNFVAISNEAEELAGEFLTELANIAKTIVIPGNHDIMSKNKNRVNSIRPIVKLLNNPNILYLEKSGFYEDGDIIWVNYSHIEKHIIPWIDIPHTKNNDKIYIGLFHDPINNSVTDLGMKFTDKKYKNVAFFDKNYYCFLNDIHKLQYFRENKSMAYSSSLIQQNFGESVENHGFIEWQIESKDEFKSIFHHIHNEHNYINFTIPTNTDYNNLNLTSKHLTEQSEVKVKWQDISANVNNENEIKIRQYFKDKYNLPKIKVKREAIYTDMSGVEMINESIDLTNIDVQKEIFIEFLKLNGYKKDFINEILDIDTIINDRMDQSKNTIGVNWSINKFWFENFKSYGDETIIDWESNNGIYQLTGINQQGKTTILDAICYIIYGKTLTTLKREKNSDNRYINNKRDLDYCNGGAIISINEQEYTILRRTERKWNRNKTEITSCSTSVNYYIGRDIIDDANLTDEQKKDTQKIIENTIGDFTDFIRLVLTTADNLNDLISMDRSVFIDSVIRYAGYDIFEKKLEEFKIYKKELNSSRIDFDLTQYEENKKIHNENMMLLESKFVNKIMEIKVVEEKKKPLIKEKDGYLSQMHQIDKSLENFDLINVKDKIEVVKLTIEKREEQLTKIEQLKEEIKNYNNVELIEKRDKLNNLKDEINDLNIQSKDFDIEIGKLSSDIKTINMDIKNIIDQHIRTLEKEIETNDNEISKLKTDFNDKIIKLKSDIKENVHKITLQQNNVQTKIDNLMNDGKLLKVENNDLEHSKICITCHRPLEEKDIIIIGEKIEKNKSRMLNIMEEVKLLKIEYNNLNESIKNKESILIKISEKDYNFDNDLKESYYDVLNKISNYKNNNEEINKNITLIKDDNLSNNLRLKLKSSYEQKEYTIDKINNIEKEKEKLINHISIKKSSLETIKIDIIILEEEEVKYQKKKEAIALEDKINLDIIKCKSEILNLEKEIETYNNELHKIQHNKDLLIKINDLNILLDELDIQINEKSNEKSNIDANMMLINSKLEELDKILIKFKEQQKRDEILTVYLKCVHRDGIPTYLLKKSISIINQELNNILTDVDYTIYFDEELNLKLSNDNRLDVCQGIEQSSGMERTFAAVSLKIALRSVNSKSKCSMLMLDEIMSKLVDSSVEKFIDLLDSIKNQVDKLIIIEHDKTINYDYLITVEKDEYGISSLKM